MFTLIVSVSIKNYKNPLGGVEKQSDSAVA